MSTAAATPRNPSASRQAAELARAIDAVLESLLNLLWTWARYAAWLGPLFTPIRARIIRTRRRIANSLARLAAAKPQPPPRTRAPRARPAAPPDQPRIPVRRHGWLGHMLDHHIRGCSAQLSHILHQPGNADLLAAAPGALRTMRPLCRMLGAELPPTLKLPPRPRRKPRLRQPGPEPKTEPEPETGTAPCPAAPPQPRPTPDRPLQPYVRRAVRHWKRRGLWLPCRPEKPA